jgi:hypothetical protein
MKNFTTTVRSVTVAALIGAAAVGLTSGIANAAHTTAGLYGDPAAATSYWVEQTLDDCSLMATADVVGQLTGHEPTEQEIVALAGATPSAHHDGPIYLPPPDLDDVDSGHGTDSRDLPILLAHYGIHATYTDDDVAGEIGVPTGMGALEDAVGGGHEVIAGVNAEMIWGTDGDRTQADHDLVVTGVDTEAGIVHLNDSGTEDGADEQVPIDLFEAAWQTSGHDMVITVETA